MSSIQNIVIIGAGQAGGWAARNLRALGFAGRIVLIGDEDLEPYERPPLSKGVLTGLVSVDSAALFQPGEMHALGIDWIGDAEVVSIDRGAQQVSLADGRKFAWDRLIISTGGRPRPLNLPNADRTHVLRNANDAAAIKHRFESVNSVAVIGGGWIGLEIASTARELGREVTIIEQGQRLCERSLPSEVADHLLRMHQARGIGVMLGRTVLALNDIGNGSMELQLDDGGDLRADVVIAGIGMIANDELARRAGLACDNGIIVDATCATSDPRIFAAGDVTIAPNRWVGRSLRLESWQNAQEQGLAAAASVLGQAVDYHPLPWFWSEQHGANIQIYGVASGSSMRVVRGDTEMKEPDGSCIYFYLEGDIITSVIGINAGRDLRRIKRLIETRKPVNPVRLADAAVPLTAF